MVSGERVISVGINYLLYSAICLNGTVVGLHTNLLKYLCVGAKERERRNLDEHIFGMFNFSGLDEEK